MDAEVWLENIGNERELDGGDCASFQKSSLHNSVPSSFASNKYRKEITERSAKIGINTPFFHFELYWKMVTETR